MPLHRHRVTHTRPLSSENTGAAARRNPRPSAAPVFIHPRRSGRARTDPACC